MWVSEARVRALLMGEAGQVGLIAELLGARLNSNALKGVHAMNDVAQTALGGTPAHRGDVLAAAAREPVQTEKEDATDAGLRANRRWGAGYQAAFPEALEPYDTLRARAAVRALVAADGGIYRPGDGMNSPLAAHIGLLGADKNFVGVGLGRLLFELLDEDGRALLRSCFTDRSDPHTRALLPLLLDGPLDPLHRALPEVGQTAFDRSLGAALSTLLRHDLSKLTRLRLFLLAGGLGFVLRVLGRARPDGRPAVFATAGDELRARVPPPARSLAVESYRLGLGAAELSLAQLLLESLRADGALLSVPPRGGDAIEVLDEPRAIRAAVLDLASGKATRDGVEGDSGADPAAAGRGGGGRTLYLPDAALKSFGRRCGFLRPRSDRAGWPVRVHLDGELITALVLMFTSPEEGAVPWTLLWRRIGEELGLVIGVNPSEDAARLRAIGVEDAPPEALAENSERALTDAVHQGVARRLPDSGAEAGGGVQ
jgi:hypothetical protein